MLKKKEVWNVVDETRAKPTTVMQIKKREKDNAVVFKIIKQGVNSNFYTNIIGEHNLQQC